MLIFITVIFKYKKCGWTKFFNPISIYDSSSRFLFPLPQIGFPFYLFHGIVMIIEWSQAKQWIIQQLEKKYHPHCRLFENYFGNKAEKREEDSKVSVVRNKLVINGIKSGMNVQKNHLRSVFKCGKGDFCVI